MVKGNRKKPKMFRGLLSYLIMLVLMFFASVAVHLYSYEIMTSMELASQSEIVYLTGKIQTFMFWQLAICLTIALALGYWFAKIDYDPFKEVMEALGYYDRDYDREDYEWLMEQKELFQKEHQKTRQELAENKSILRQQDLYRLISLPYDKRYQKYDELAKEKLFEKENTLVFLCHIIPLEHESVYAHVNRTLSRVALKNMIDEMLKERMTIEVVDMLDSYACIVNTEKNSVEGKELLEEVLDELQHFMVDTMSLQPIFAFGEWKNGIDGVHASYMLAREAVEYQSLMQGTQFVWFEDIKTDYAIYQYSMDIEQKIMNAICVGNSKDVNKWIDEVLDVNYHKLDITHHMKRYLVADLIGTIFKGAEQAGSSQFILKCMDDNPMTEEWSAHWDEKVLREYLHKMVSELCEGIQNNESLKRDDKQFGLQVIEYVKGNYHNPDLNISITALHFGITPSYLSALFKEQTGHNLLEYINHVRVEEAKKLLEKGYSLVEICDRTGFRSSGALIRVFKKETGVTPGQMKKILGQANGV